MVPTPELADKDIIRVYLGFCDHGGVSRIGFIEVDADDPSRIVKVSNRPVLDIGVPGAFDDNGVVPSSIITRENVKLLYYYGFQLGVKVRYFIFSGLALSRDGGETFERYSTTPILERSPSDLFVRSAPFPILEERTWKLWYVGGSSWAEVGVKLVPVYRVKYLESPDGVSWRGEGVPCIDFKDRDEHGFGRPFVIKEGGSYKMFYSTRTRSKGYRLGYAESEDGKSWKRKDEDIGIDVSSSGWDSEMICFASIVRSRGKTYMFYNGNNFGETGVGYAVME
jgi:predicted GH43/DUF377 family glycosyl hydrolase